MAEPPILPNPDYQSEPQTEINPFAPTSIGLELDGAVGRTELSNFYWIALTVMLFVSVAMTLFGLPIGWGGIVISVTAAIRVPLLQRRHARFHHASELPNSFALFFTSLALMVAFVIVSFIAFAAVCIPGSIAFTMGDLGSAIFSLSILASLICFCTLFYLSLRLPF
jgi:hypothetical protein